MRVWVKQSRFFSQKGLGLVEGLMVLSVGAILFGVSLYQYNERKKDNQIEILQRSVAKIEAAAQRYTLYVLQPSRAKTDSSTECNSIESITMQCLVTRGLLKESDVINPFGTGKGIQDFTLQLKKYTEASATQPRPVVRLEICTAVKNYKAPITGLKDVSYATALYSSTCIPSGFTAPRATATSKNLATYNDSEKGWLVWEFNPLSVSKKILTAKDVEGTAFDTKAANTLREQQASEGDVIKNQEEIEKGWVKTTALSSATINAYPGIKNTTPSVNIIGGIDRANCEKVNGNDICHASGGSVCRFVDSGRQYPVFECTNPNVTATTYTQPWWAGCIRLRRGDTDPAQGRIDYTTLNKNGGAYGTFYRVFYEREDWLAAMPLWPNSENIEIYGYWKVLLGFNGTSSNYQKVANWIDAQGTWSCTTKACDFSKANRDYMVIQHGFANVIKALNTFGQRTGGPKPQIPTTQKGNYYYGSQIGSSRTAWVCEPACNLVSCDTYSCKYRCDKNAGYWQDPSDDPDWQEMGTSTNIFTS